MNLDQAEYVSSMPLEEATVMTLAKVKVWCKANLDACREVVELLTKPRDYSWEHDVDEMLMAFEHA